MRRIYYNFLLLLSIGLLPQFFFAFYKNISFLDIGQIVSFIVILFLPYLFIHHVFFRKVYYFLFIFLLSVNTITEIIYLLVNGLIINGTGLKIFFESNSKELIGYISEIIPFYVYLIFMVLLFFLFKLLLNLNHHNEKFLIIKRDFWFICFAICFFIGTCLYTKSNIYGPFLNVHNAYSETKSYYKELREIRNTNNKNLAGCSYTLKDKKKKLYVLIIGESTSRNHMSLYGYYRNTNEKLSQRNDIAIFKDVISSKANTLSSLSEALTLPDTVKKKHDFTCINILDICKLAQLETIWLSNQASIGFYNNSVALTAQSADKVIFTTIESNDNILTSRNYDETLFPLFTTSLQEINKTTLIVVHLMGAHSPYYKRYPIQFSKYYDTIGIVQRMPFANKRSKCEKVNHYDNAIAYNDIVIDSFLNILKRFATATNISTSAIYFSDHGEEMYDVDNRIGHDEGYMASKQYEIPFITWSSNYKYDSSILNRPYILKNFTQTLTHWLGIEGTYLDSNLSIFSSTYMPIKRELYDSLKTITP